MPRHATEIRRPGCTGPTAYAAAHDGHEADELRGHRGMERAPARAMLRAVGMTDDDWGKAQVGVASSWNEVTPCNLPLDRLAKRAKEGVRRRRRLPARVRDHRGQRRHLDGPRGDARLPREPRDHRRLRRVRDARRAARRARHVRGLRQEPAGDADGGGAAQPADRVPLRRLDHAGPVQGPGARHRERVRGGRRVRGRDPHRERARRDREAGVSHRGLVRGDVHGEHDGVGG